MRKTVCLLALAACCWSQSGAFAATPRAAEDAASPVTFTDALPPRASSKPMLLASKATTSKPVAKEAAKPNKAAKPVPKASKKKSR